MSTIRATFAMCRQIDLLPGRLHAHMLVKPAEFAAPRQRAGREFAEGAHPVSKKKTPNPKQPKNPAPAKTAAKASGTPAGAPKPTVAATSPRGGHAAKGPKSARPAKPARPRRASVLDAAATVLAGASKPMSAGNLIAAMEARKLWKSPGGKTPEATLSAAIGREIKTKGAAARFRKAERGLFTAGAK